jgi:hypothetical protein
MDMEDSFPQLEDLTIVRAMGLKPFPHLLPGEGEGIIPPSRGLARKK